MLKQVDFYENFLIIKVQRFFSDFAGKKGIMESWNEGISIEMLL